MNMPNKSQKLLACTLLFFVTAALPAWGGRADAILKMIWKGSDEVVEPAMKATDSRIVSKAVATYGDEAAAGVFERGGYAFLQQARAHGDELVAAAVRVPGSESILTTNPSFMLGAVRRYGDDALRLEKEVPGFLEMAPLRLGDGEIRTILKATPENRRYMAHLVKLSDSPETARRMVAEYSKRGPGWLKKLPRKEIVIGGVLTAAIVDQAVRGEESLPSKMLDKGLEAAVKLVLKVLAILGVLLGLPWLLWKLLKYRVRRFFARCRKRDDNEAGSKPVVAENSCGQG